MANDKAAPASGPATADADAPKKSSTTATKLPPGMVLGPDGKPCKICTAFRNWKPPIANSDPSSSASKKPSFSNASASSSSFASVTGVMSALASGAAPASTSSSTNATQNQTRPDTPPEGCPPDVEQLGRATWTFLHTTAAYYPEHPTPLQRTRMLGLLMALPVLYPCSHCAQHLGERMNTHPPDLRGGRVSLSRWLCERHNEVNEMLGKPLFDCSIKSTDERWKDGPSDGRCD